MFPPGHQDRKLTIEQILFRDYKEQCLSGGAAEESHGGVSATATGKEDTDLKREDGDADADALLAAAVEELER